MSWLRNAFSRENRGRTAMVGAAVGVGLYAAYRAGRALYDHMYPARAHVRDMRARGMNLDHITPDALNAQRLRLRRQGVVAATSMHDHISLTRRGNQSAEQFTDFMVDTRRALHTIASQPQGRGMLDRLNAGPNASVLDMHSTVTISDARFDRHGFDPNAGNGANAEGMLNAREGIRPDAAPGFGEATMVHFNPTITRSDGHRPAFIGLAHELVHAERNQLGVAIDRRGELGMRALRDELETVGLMPGPQPVSENDIRHEHGVAPRTSYAGQTRNAYIQALREMQQRRQGGGVD